MVGLTLHLPPLITAAQSWLEHPESGAPRPACSEAGEGVGGGRRGRMRGGLRQKPGASHSYGLLASEKAQVPFPCLLRQVS